MRRVRSLKFRSLVVPAVVALLMLGFMAVLVGTIMLAIYYPLLKLYSGSTSGTV